MLVFPAVTVKPTAEPVTLGQLRASVNADGNYADATLLGYMIGARSFVEKHTSYRIMPQTVVAQLVEWPCDGVIEPAVAPLNTVSITYTDAAGETATLATDQYVIRPRKGRDNILKEIRPSAVAGTWPTLGADPLITITMTVGFADANAVDEDLKHAIILLAAHWNANREPVNIGNIVKELPFGLASLISSNKLVH